MPALARSSISALAACERIATKRCLSTSSALASSSSSSSSSPSLSRAATAGSSRNAASGAARVAYRREFSTSTPRDSWMGAISDRLAKVALGSNYASAKARGGVLPEEQRRQDLARQRDAAMASVSPDGSQLFDDTDALPSVRSAERAAARQSAKAAARVARKRWGGSDAAVPEHKYSTALFKISPRKLQMLADQIAHKPIDHAILQMQFSAKRAAGRIRATLALARDHAADKGLDLHRLVVAEAWVSKGRYLKRADIKGRARMGKKEHPSAKMSLVLRYGKTEAEKQAQQLADAKKAVRSIGDGSVTRTNRKVINAWQRPGWQW